jgi:hypothetical protein
MGTGRPGAVRDPVIPAVACAARAVTPRAGVAGGVSTVSTAVAASTAASP